MSMQVCRVSEGSEVPIDDGGCSILVKAPALIHALGRCVALARTKEACSISLAGSKLQYDDLATNLVKIANTGQNAFATAYSDMLNIGARTNNMARIDGILDRIIATMNETQSEKAARRLLNRLQVDVKECDLRGESTERDFTNWRNGVQAFQEAVVTAQSRMTEHLNKEEEQIKINEADLEKKIEEFKLAKEQTNIARERHERASAEQKNLEESLLLKAFDAFQAASAAKIGMILSGLPGAIVGVGIAQFITSGSSRNVAEAMDDMYAQRRARLELEHQFLEIELALEKHQHSSKGLSHLIWAIVVVLKQLEALATDICDLIKFFKRMNMSINMMVTEHEDTLKAIAEDQVKGILMNNADFRSFVESAYQMKKLALTVNSLSTLYSEVISKIVDPGFSVVAQVSQYREGRSIKVFADEQKRLDQYLGGAETQCKLFAVDAKQRLEERLKQMEIEKKRDMQRNCA